MKCPLALYWMMAIGLLSLPAVGQQNTQAQADTEIPIYHRMPTPEQIQKGDKFVPPRVGAYAQRLANQPDMMGTWMWEEPTTAGEGPVFDPEHAAYAPKPADGEQTFGPVAGTYIKDIPYKPEYREKYQQLIGEVLQGKSRDTFAACFPYGVPRMLGDTAGPFDIIQSPEVMLWYDAYGRTARRIFLDGRGHPRPSYKSIEDPQGEDPRTYSGHSVGHWDGHTLVVDTVNMLAGYFDQTPAPYSQDIHLIERIRLIDTNIMEDRITIIDPVMLERPWVVTRYFRRMKAGADEWPTELASDGQPISHGFSNLNDRPCIPNVRIDADGFQIQMLPQELEAEKAKRHSAPPP